MAVAAIQIIIGALVMPAAVIDGVVYLILGLLLFFLQSRIAAILAGGLALLSLIFTIDSDSNIFLAIAIMYVAIVGVYSTFKYQKVVHKK